MNYMFRLNDRNKIVSEFKISYFLACYKHFWTSTLLYESGTFCVRTLSFDWMRQKEVPIVPAGFVSGVLGQALLMPFFIRSL